MSKGDRHPDAVAVLAAVARAVCDFVELAEQLDERLVVPAEFRDAAAMVCEPILPSATDRALAEIWAHLRDEWPW